VAHSTPNISPVSLTLKADGRILVLRTDVFIGAPVLDPSAGPVTQQTVGAKKFGGIWDTGATNTTITTKVVKECNLQPISFAQVHTANGMKTCKVYLVSLFLPNGLGLQPIRVTEVDALADADVLIGMDVITLGDFAVTNRNGKTTFTFRFPSVAEIDFVRHQKTKETAKIGRNDPCPCDSGEKYKKCCGRQ